MNLRGWNVCSSSPSTPVLSIPLPPTSLLLFTNFLVLHYLLAIVLLVSNDCSTLLYCYRVPTRYSQPTLISNRLYAPCLVTNNFLTSRILQNTPSQKNTKQTKTSPTSFNHAITNTPCDLPLHSAGRSACLLVPGTRRILCARRQTCSDCQTGWHRQPTHL